MIGPQPALFTIGYETATLSEVVERLGAAGVELLIDVRAVASSRRPGFSKTMLAATLRDAGIDYLHLRALGTPRDGRAAARAGRVEEMRRIYADHLADPATASALAEAGEIAANRPTALLCYEADASHCHRRMIAERLGMVTRDL